MFRRLTIGKKIIFGFACVLTILGVIATIGYNRIGYIADLSSLVQKSTEDNGFLVQKEVDHLNWAKSLSGSILGGKEISVEVDPKKCGFGKWLYTLLDDSNLESIYPAGIITTLKSIEPMHKKLHQSAKHIKEVHTVFDTNILDTMKNRWIEHLSWMKNLQMMLLSGAKFNGGLDPHLCKFGKWFYSYKSTDIRFSTILQKMEAPHKRLHDSAKKLVSLYNSGDSKNANIIFKDVTVPALEELSVVFGEGFTYLEGMSAKKSLSMKYYQEEAAPALHLVQILLKELRDKFQNHMISIAGDAAKDLSGTAYFAKTFMMVAGIIAIIIGLILALFITKSITAPILRISSGLRDSSGQVSSASVQLSSASQELSSSSNEQASSIQETSSSLEEITGMVNSNVDKAKTCVELSESVNESSNRGNTSMQELMSSMSEILDSNVKIQELVKVIGEIGEKTEIIDEIVFQTKLLSFNASVEAERAGEHGRGFAVVAQEVGNLAQMSGKAATEISTIVKSGIKNAEEISNDNKARVEAGNDIVKSSAEILQDISMQSKTLLENINSILGASEDQATGVSQINIAVTELDKATQENAATAEETASSSEELSAQAENLNVMVKELTMLVTGDTGASSNSKEFGQRAVVEQRSNIVKIDQYKTKITPKNSEGGSKEWEAI